MKTSKNKEMMTSGDVKENWVDSKKTISMLYNKNKNILEENGDNHIHSPNNSVDNYCLGLKVTP